MKKRFLGKLITVKLTDDPQQIAAGLIDIAFSSADDRTEALGEAIDDAVAFSGPVGGLLEAVDGAVAERLAELGQALIEQTLQRTAAAIDDRIGQLEQRLRERGVPEASIGEVREILRLDELIEPLS